MSVLTRTEIASIEEMRSQVANLTVALEKERCHREEVEHELTQCKCTLREAEDRIECLQNNNSQVCGSYEELHKQYYEIRTGYEVLLKAIAGGILK